MVISLSVNTIFTKDKCFIWKNSESDWRESMTILNKMNKRVLTLVAIVSVLTISGVALALNGNWFLFLPNFEGLDEAGPRASEQFILTELPDYFQASVIVGGSGYTGQLHTVDVLINHNRPDSSVWLASGNYSLDLELEVGTSVEIITSGSFSELRKGTPYTAPQQPWIPVSLANTYQIVLSLDNILWTLSASFSSEGGRLEGNQIQWMDWDAIYVNSTFEGLLEYSYEPLTETVSFTYTIQQLGTKGTWTMDYYWVLERVGGGNRQTVIPETLSEPLAFNGGFLTLSDSFTAPEAGEWVLILYVEAIH